MLCLTAKLKKTSVFLSYSYHSQSSWKYLKFQILRWECLKIFTKHYLDRKQEGIQLFEQFPWREKNKNVKMLFKICRQTGRKQRTNKSSIKNADKISTWCYHITRHAHLKNCLGRQARTTFVENTRFKRNLAPKALVS